MFIIISFTIEHKSAIMTRADDIKIDKKIISPNSLFIPLAKNANEKERI